VAEPQPIGFVRRHARQRTDPTSKPRPARAAVTLEISAGPLAARLHPRRFRR